MTEIKGELEAIWRAGVAAVEGKTAVATALSRMDLAQPDQIVAVGKAAASMARAALDHFGADTPCLVATKTDHAAEADLPSGVEVIEASHPVPDAMSLKAGARVLETVSGMKSGQHLLLLVSGGASSLVEVLDDGLTLDDLAAENERLLAAGLDIHAMNRRRKELSRVKGGKLLGAFSGDRATVLVISDVEGDDIGVIGSGIGAAPLSPAFEYTGEVVASNAIARAAAAKEAERLGRRVLSSKETLYCDVAEAADRIATDLDKTEGVRIWGGEPTVVLPDDPGEGGRNQALALRVAERIAGRSGTSVLVAGTDGSDGPTRAAGGLVDGSTWSPEAAQHLARADSGPYLDRRGALFVTGPTGTNVMDLAVAITEV
jgi:hydroxypyruvate reductase